VCSERRVLIAVELQQVQSRNFGDIVRFRGGGVDEDADREERRVSRHLTRGLNA
jgi:hypothetical protein